MADAHLDAKAFVDMLSQVLGGIDAAMLTTRTAKAEHEGGEATLDVTTHMVVSQFIDGIEEGQNLTIVLEESDNGLVESRQLLIRLVTSRVVRRTAVEHIATTIATLIVGDALGVGEAIDANHQRTLCIVLGERGRSILRVGLIGILLRSLQSVSTHRCGLHLLELRHLGQPVEHIDQIRIGEVALVQQLTQILDSGRDGLDEVLLALEIATETIGAQHLQQAEQHKQAQAVDEMVRLWHLSILFQRMIVFIHQLSAHLIRIFGRSLPQERGQVVIVRTTTTTLEVDEVGFAIAVQHDIARLEVTIEETLRVLLGSQVLGQQAEVGLQLHFVEVELGSLQETVFEVVEVEQDGIGVELRLRIAIDEVQFVGTIQLDVRQFADGTTQQVNLLHIVTTTCLTTTTNGIEQRGVAQVGLDIAQLIVADSQYLRHWQLLLGKVLGKIDEGVIFITTGTHAAYHTNTLTIGQSVILTIAASSGEAHHILGLFALPLLV